MKPTCATTASTDDRSNVQITPQGHLEMLFRSALATALCFELEPQQRSLSINADLREKQSEERRRKRSEELLKEINDQSLKIEELGRADNDLRTYTVARAVSRNARGSAHYKMGDYEKAIPDFHDAITFMPDFLDAYLNLAEIFLDQPGKSAAEWTRDANDLLDQALLQSPSSQRAHFLKGKLLCRPTVARYQEAKDHLIKAELFPWSYLYLAEILADQDHDLPSALQVLRKSLLLFPEPDYRSVYYITLVLRLTKGEREPIPMPSIPAGSASTPAPTPPPPPTATPPYAPPTEPLIPTFQLESSESLIRSALTIGRDLLRRTDRFRNVERKVNELEARLKSQTPPAGENTPNSSPPVPKAPN